MVIAPNTTARIIFRMILLLDIKNLFLSDRFVSDVSHGFPVSVPQLGHIGASNASFFLQYLHFINGIVLPIGQKSICLLSLLELEQASIFYIYPLT